MDITEVKAMLRIKDNEEDEYLASVLPSFEEKIKQYTNNRFKDADGNETLPPDVKHTLAKWVQWDMNNVSGLESYSMGEVNENYSNKLPDFVKRDLSAYRKVRFQ